jgi:hypothetical protein
MSQGCSCSGAMTLEIFQTMVFCRQLWPVIVDANSAAEAFSQIGRDMIIPVSADRTNAQTGKGHDNPRKGLLGVRGCDRGLW